MTLTEPHRSTVRERLRPVIGDDDALDALMSQFPPTPEDRPVTEATFRTAMTGMDGDMTGLRTDVDELKTDVAILKTDVAILKTDVAELKTDVAELKTDVAILKTDVAELKTDVGGLRVDLDALRTEHGAILADHGSKLDALAAGLSELRADMREGFALIELSAVRHANTVFLKVMAMMLAFTVGCVGIAVAIVGSTT